MNSSTLTKNKTLLRDSFNFQPSEIIWELNESQGDSKVDGKIVLARVRGPFFLVNEVSLNGRFYPKSLWESTIAKSHERLESGGMFGAVGHDVPIDEAAIRTGAVSHTTVKLWIDEARGVGMGEILVLNTESGKELNTLLRAGMPIPVSSRAYGNLSGKTESGADIIEEDSFVLECFDFVVNPGVSNAFPKVVEHLEKPITEDISDMTVELLEKKISENHDLTAQLNEALKENKALKEANEKLENLRKVAEFYKKNVGSIAETREISEKLRLWLEREPLKTWAIESGWLGRANTPNVTEMAEAAIKLGDEYAATGNPADIKALVEAAEAYVALGKPSEIRSAFKLLETYIAFGKPSDVAKKLEAAKKIREKLTEAKQNTAAQKIAKKFNVNAKAVLEMLKHMPAAKVVENLKSLKETAETEKRLKVVKTNESAPKSEESTQPNFSKSGWAQRYQAHNRMIAEELAKTSVPLHA
jgi:tetratricopeptide (TPR) repeat protein